jgi:hypothetical protein
MGVAAILAQDPHSKPASTDRSPAPFVHASDDSTEMEFRAAYRAFVDAFRTGAARLRERARELSDMFPRCAFPPPLPFNAPARRESSRATLTELLAEWLKRRSAPGSAIAEHLAVLKRREAEDRPGSGPIARRRCPMGPRSAPSHRIDGAVCACIEQDSGTSPQGGVLIAALPGWSADEATSDVPCR